jgi:hypothetical protein
VTPRTGAAAGRLAGALCAALLAVAACTADPKGDGLTAPPTPPIVDVSQAQKLVRGYADRVVAAVGDTTLRDPDETSLHCDEKPDDWYYFSGIYQILVPASRQGAAFTAVKDYALRHGYTIKSEKKLPDGRGQITVFNPADGVTFTLGSGESPAMVLIVNSPCYRTDKPLP